MMMMNSDLITNVRVTGQLDGEQTVVLAHGYGGNQAVWDRVLPHLSRSFRVLLFDWNLSGVGVGVDDDDEAVADDNDSRFSSFTAFADALVDLIEGLRLQGVVFVGHSMSGIIGCIASVSRPELFSHLVLVAASPRYLNSEEYEGGFERVAIDSILSSMESDFHAWVDGFVVIAVGHGDPAAVEQLRTSVKMMRPNIALALAKTIFLGDMRHVLDKVEVPSTVVQGSDDLAVPVSVGRYIQSKMKGKASLEIIQSVGHFPQLFAAQQLLEILDRVLLMTQE